MIDFENGSVLIAKIGIVLILVIGVLVMIWLISKRTKIFSKSKIFGADREGGVEGSLRNPRTLPPPIHLFGRSRSETIAINAFSHIIYEKGYSWRDLVVGYRPIWLRNPLTGRCLEIDAYHPGLNVGIEYNGIQHYKFPNHLHSNTEIGRKAFEAGQSRDRLKHRLCKLRGLKLIEIPYWVDSNSKNTEERWMKIKKHILDAL